jgi:hypothetical protein
MKPVLTPKLARAALVKAADGHADVDVTDESSGCI